MRLAMLIPLPLRRITRKTFWCSVFNPVGTVSGLLPVILSGLVLMAGMLCWSACTPRPASGPPHGMAMPVHTMEAKAGRRPDATDYVATLISRHAVVLQPQVLGKVSRIYVQPGDRVAMGAPLLQIDPVKAAATVLQVQAEAAVREADREEAKQRLNAALQQQASFQSAWTLSQSQYKRYKALYDQEYVSHETLDQHADGLSKAKADLATHQAQLLALKAAVASAEKRHEQARSGLHAEQAQLRYYTITAPFAGTVGDIPVKIGSLVQPLTALLSVTENSLLEVNLRVPAEKASALHPGMPVQLMDENDHTVLAASKIGFVSPNVDPETQTVLLKATVQNPTGVLKADQQIKARLIWQYVTGVMIPTSAVVHLAGQDFVYIVTRKGPQGFVAQQRPVTLGPVEGNHYSVLKGIQSGEMVIIRGTQKLVDGVPVKPVS